MRFLLENILFPCLAFAVLATWIIRSRKSAAPRSEKSEVLLWALGAVVCAGLAFFFLKDLSSSDGWGGNAMLFLGLGSGAVAVLCAGGFFFTLMARTFLDRTPSYGEAALRRAQARERSRRSGQAPGRPLPEGKSGKGAHNPAAQPEGEA